MAFSKSNTYLEEIHHLSQYMRAFGHSARIQIIETLCRDGLCSVEELHRNHPIARSTFSEHLEVLRDCHLVKCEERFPYTYYQVNAGVLLYAMKLIKKYFGNLLAQISGRENLVEFFQEKGSKGIESNRKMEE